jgi:protein-disulfide isomerase
MSRASFALALVSLVSLASLVACGGAPPAPKTAAPVPSAPAPVTAPAATAPGEDGAKVPIALDDATWGNRDALVTIVAFEDFQCPYCARVVPTLEKLETEYGPEKLRVVFKNLPLPFHANARAAAEAAEGARSIGGNQAFWKFAASAFADQKSLGADAYAKWARDAGVDATAFADPARAKAWSAKIDRDLDVARKVGVDGTPAFFINGAMVSGAQPAEAFEQIITAAMSQASALVAKGTPRDQVYVKAADANYEAPKEEEADAPDTHVYKVPIGASPVRGGKDAPVTIIELGDYQCPFCRRAEETLGKLRAKYGDNIRIVWKDAPLPFHDRAEPAAELALEARAEKGDAGFWAAHDALFAAKGLADADLEGIARDLSLDVAKVKQAIAKQTHDKSIDADGEVADGFGASGTPHFFINGRRLVGSRPVEQFSTIIDEEISKASALASKGVPASGIYDALTKDGVGMAGPEKKATPALPKAAPSRGDAKAKVVIQEFADFECPFCKMAQESMDKLLAAYPGRVRVVWRNMPLTSIHPDAQLAAEAAMEVLAQKGAAGFFKMQALLFENQRVDGGLQREALDGYAKQLGLDMKKWAAALDGHTHKDEVDVDVHAAESAGLQGAPAFFINGYFLDGAQPYKSFKRAVERALAEH